MSKYHNIRTEVDGIKFSSKKEAARYQELKLLERAGEIRGLKLQPKFDFPIGELIMADEGDYLTYSSGRKVVYIADFEYEELRHMSGCFSDWWLEVIEDTKGVVTPVFKLKAALMKAVHGITVRIT